MTLGSEDSHGRNLQGIKATQLSLYKVTRKEKGAITKKCKLEAHMCGYFLCIFNKTIGLSIVTLLEIVYKLIFVDKSGLNTLR